MTRRALFLLLPLLLAGCVQGTASYMADGADHAISLRAEQEYFWKDAVALKLVVSNLPDCQRQFPMTTVDTNGIEVELYGAGDGVYSMRVGAQVMRVDMASCNRLTEPTAQELGQRVGTFRIGANKKLVFEQAPDAPQPAAPAPEQRGATPEPAP
jgi:hypothetical protein